MIESIDDMLKRFQIYQYSYGSAALVDHGEMICVQFRLAHAVFPPPLYYTSQWWKLHGFQLMHALFLAHRAGLARSGIYTQCGGLARPLVQRSAALPIVA